MRPRRAPKDGAYRMLFFGRLQPYKGLDILVGAYRKLREEFSEISLEIVGLGNINEFLPGGLDVPGIRVDTRWVPEAELGEVFDRADLLITPYTEASQSGAVAVAMGVGMPVVATPVGGLLEQVGHRQSGLIARAVSEEAVAEAVRELIQNPALYESCSLGAVKQVQEKFAWDVIGRQVAGVIHSFAGTSSAARPVFAVARNGKTEFDGVGPSRGTRNGADEGI
jgi:glycosyltransferase involved in cell wall biosynthesis